jgi:type VI secretion system FHA domain protein
MLRLRIVSDQGLSLAERSSAAFSAEGGTIGRSADNDWVLPDPLRYISAHHARVLFREGHFYLLDVSTNGVYVNDDMEPLAKRGSSGYRLADGDVLRMGEYHIVASLAAASASADEKADAAVPTSIHALHPLGRGTDGDIGAQLDVEELLVRPVIDMDPVLPVGAYGQAVDSDRVHALAGSHDQDADALLSGTAGVQGAPSVAASLRRVAGVVRESRVANVLALHDVHTGLDAFCRGAGIEPEQLPAESQVRLLHLAGRLLREALVGFKDLERTRAATRNRYRIEAPPREADDPRPSLADSVEELLVALFAQHEARRLDSVQWMRETLAEAKRHEDATAQAMRAGFIEFLDRLDPAELEARFERAARRGKARSADKAQYWDLFTTFYRNLIEMPADHLPHTFVEAFAAAYREALKKPD